MMSGLGVGLDKLLRSSGANRKHKLCFRLLTARICSPVDEEVRDSVKEKERIYGVGWLAEFLVESVYHLTTKRLAVQFNNLLKTVQLKLEFLQVGRKKWFNKRI